MMGDQYSRALVNKKEEQIPLRERVICLRWTKENQHKLVHMEEAKVKSTWYIFVSTPAAHKPFTFTTNIG